MSATSAVSSAASPSAYAINSASLAVAPQLPLDLAQPSPISAAAPSLVGRVAVAEAPSSEALVASVFEQLRPIAEAYVQEIGKKIAELRESLIRPGEPLADEIQQKIAEHTDEITKLKIQGLQERVTVALIETQVKAYLAVLTDEDLNILLEHLRSDSGKLSIQILTLNARGGFGLTLGSVIVNIPIPIRGILGKIGDHFRTRPDFLKQVERFLGKTNLA